MADTGWLNPTSCTGTSWSNTESTYSEDGSYASYSVGKNSTSNAIKVTGFNVNNYITNSSSTINGVEVRIKRYASNSSSLSDGSLQLIISGSPSGTNKAVSTTWGTFNAFSQTYGGSADLWGNTITYLNAIGTFGVNLTVTNATNSSRTAYIDIIQIKIYYTAPIEYYVSSNTNITSNPTWNATPKLKYVNKVDSTLLLI